jgi:hypothetical protein
MGYDSLIQVGKDLKEHKDSVEHITRRVAENFPVIEKSLDNLGTLYTFRMEFYTYTDHPVVSLDIEFFSKFISPFYVEG